MIVADLGRAFLLAAVPVAYVLDVLALEQLYVVAFLSGTLAVLSRSRTARLFVSLVAKEDYLEANTLLNGSRAMSFVAGPSAAGILVQLLTAPIALLADALSYLVSALFLPRIQPVEPPPAGDVGPGHRRGAAVHRPHPGVAGGPARYRPR